MDFLLLIVVACGLVWTTWFVLRGSLLAGCMAMIAVAASFGYFFWHSQGGFPLTIDRLFIVLVGRHLRRAPTAGIGRSQTVWPRRLGDVRLSRHW